MDMSYPSPWLVFSAHPAHEVKHVKSFPQREVQHGHSPALAGVRAVSAPATSCICQESPPKQRCNAVRPTQLPSPWLSPSLSASAYLLHSLHRPNRPGSHLAQESARKEERGYCRQILGMDRGKGGKNWGARYIGMASVFRQQANPCQTCNPEGGERMWYFGG